MTTLGRNAAALAELVRRRWRRARDAGAARRAAAFARGRPLLRAPETLAIGDAEAAGRLARGEIVLAGARVALPAGRDPWRARPPSDAWRDALHGMAWIDDALAAGKRDRATLRGWVFAWLKRYGDGSGPGWRPALAGRRLARLVAAAPAFLQGATARERRRYERAVAAHCAFLAARWASRPDPLERLEAAAGWALGALAREAKAGAPKRATAALGRAAAEAVDAQGGVASRDPEALGRAFALLAWTAHGYAEAGVEPDPRHLAALKRAGPALRALRLGDGGLARFHGGGAMADGTLDQAFALAGARGRGARRDAAMGFQRLAAGGTVVVLDAGPPPPGPRAAASALAIEIGVGLHRLAGGIGPGAGLSGDWPVAARATAAHAAVEVAGVSCARLAPAGFAGRVLGRPLVTGPSAVSADRAEDEQGLWALAEHDGYLARFGLVLARRLNLAPGGAALRGEDTLHAPTAEARARFDAAQRDGGVPFVLRFHLPPTVRAEPSMDGRGARLHPPSGPAWTFRASGGRVALSESVWLEDGAAAPSAARQLVVAARAEAYFGRVTWSFQRDPPRPRAAAQASGAKPAAAGRDAGG